MKKTILTFLFAFTVLIGIEAQDLQLDTDGTTLPSTSNLITPGDANCDEIVDILDAITSSNYVLGYNPTPFCFENADINGDGIINIADIILLVDIILTGGTGGFTCGVSTVTDIDGNEYNTVLIGDQCWMASNLIVTRTPGGQAIARYCYNNEPLKCQQYGGLYNWNTVMNGASGSSSNPSGVQGICPDGWHVPSDAEWTQLTNYVEPFANNGVSNTLKSCRQTDSPLGGGCQTNDHPRWVGRPSGAGHFGTDDFGFAGLPAGYSSPTPVYGGMGDWSMFWTTTIDNNQTDRRWIRRFWSTHGDVVREILYFNNRTTVRCIKG